MGKLRLYRDLARDGPGGRQTALPRYPKTGVANLGWAASVRKAGEDVFVFGDASTFAAGRRSNWLRFLPGPKGPELHRRIRPMDRNMWCTGGFLHAVGETVTRAGEILPLAGVSDPVFTFDPVQVTCTPDGVTHWTPGAGTPPRYLFHVRDEERYEAAMTAALKSKLLRGLSGASAEAWYRLAPAVRSG